MRHHVGEASTHAHVVVQFLGGALRPRDDLLYLGSLTPAVLVRVQHDVVNLETCQSRVNVEKEEEEGGEGGGGEGVVTFRGGNRKSVGIDEPCAHDGRVEWPLQGAARPPPSDDTSIP